LDGKDVLVKIDSRCDNAHGFPLSSFVKWMTTESPFVHVAAVRFRIRFLGTGKSLSLVGF